MNEFEITYGTYDEQQLVNVLESIDDIEYPERAVIIYKLLTKALLIRAEKIDSRYEEAGFMDELLEFVFCFTFVGTEPTNVEMREKLSRIRKKAEYMQTEHVPN